MGSRLYGYNSGAPVSGASQSGSLAISNDSKGGGSVQWFNGPNEDLGYVIGYPDTTGTRKVGGVTVGNAVGFMRTSSKTDAEFLSLANFLTNQGFVTASVAANWLNTNGYYTSYTTSISVNTAQIYYDPGNSSSYSGSGTTLTNIGTLGNVTGTLGTLSGVAYNSGVSSGVFDFDGVSDKITFGQYNFGNTITVNVWIYPRTEFSINCLISNCAANTNTNGFKMSWNNWNSTNYTLNFEAGNGSSGNTTSTGDNIVVASTWQMITFVFNKTTPSIKFYKNGVEIATASGGSPVANIGMNNTNWWMGSIGGNSYYMNAYMGQFKVWTSLRTISEVLSEYNDSKSRYGL